MLENVLCCTLVINSLEYEDCCIDCINIKLHELEYAAGCNNMNIDMSVPHC